MIKYIFEDIVKYWYSKNRQSLNHYNVFNIACTYDSPNPLNIQTYQYEMNKYWWQNIVFILKYRYLHNLKFWKSEFSIAKNHEFHAR